MDKNIKKPFDKTKAISKPRLKEPNLLREKNSHHEWYSGDPFQTGVEYLRNNNFELAARALSENLKKDAEDIPTRLGLGLSYLNLNQYHEAVEEFLHVLKMEPENYDARSNLSTAYFKLGLYEKCVKELHSLLKLGSDAVHRFNSEPVRKRLASALMLLANKQYQANLTGEALKNYLESDEMESNNPAVHYQIGLCYKTLNEPEKAVFFLESALKHNKDKEKKWELYNLLFEMKAASGQSEEALKVANQMIAAFPEQARAHFLAAEIHYRNKNYDAALKKFEHALSCDKSYIQALINMGEIYIIKKQIIKAHACYNKALSIEPDNPVALCNLAIIKYNRDEKIGAFTILSKLAASNGANNYLVHKYLGLIWLEKGEPEKAALRLQQAVALNSSDPDIFINLGVSFHQLKKSEKAASFYHKALELEPDNLLALRNLSLLYFESNNHQEALDLFDRILELEPDNKLILKRKGHTYRKMGAYEKAVETYKQYMTKEPKSVEVLFNLAVIYYETEVLDKATEMFTSLLPVGHYYTPACYCYLSKIYEKQKELDKALDCAKKSVYVNAKFVDGFIQYGKICLLLNQKDKALKYFEKALSLDLDNPTALSLAQPLYKELGLITEEVEEDYEEPETEDPAQPVAPEEHNSQLREDDFDIPAEKLNQAEKMLWEVKQEAKPEERKIVELMDVENKEQALPSSEQKSLVQTVIKEKTTEKFYSVNYSKVPEPEWEPELDESEIDELPEDF